MSHVDRDIFDLIEEERIEREIVSSFGGVDQMIASLAAEKVGALSFATVEEFMADLDAFSPRQKLL